MILGISHSADPVGSGGSTWVEDNWTRYLVPLYTNTDTIIDRPSMGVDGNGVYIEAWVVGKPMALAALPKGPLTNDTAQIVQDQFILRDASVGFGHVALGVNFDPVAAGDPEWILVGELSAADIYCGSVVWDAEGKPSLSQWASLPVTRSCDLLYNVVAPQPGSSYGVDLGSDLAGSPQVTVRKIDGTQYLWWCRDVYVNAAGDADAGGGTPDRSAVECFKIQTAPSPTIAETARINDDAAADPMFYYYGSVAVSDKGDMVVGFSGSGADSYIGAYYWLASMSKNTVGCLLPGKNWYGDGSQLARWGDYSRTALDPSDGATVWTIQAYTEERDPNYTYSHWATRVAAITPY